MPLIDAYRLQEAQDWLSVGFSRLCGCPAAVSSGSTQISELHRPRSRSSARIHRCAYCINWADEAQFRRHSFNTKLGLADCYQRAQKALAGDVREAEKLRVRIKHELLEN